MDTPKYLIIITLIDGQNFTVPEGAPDKLEATVFAEARFGSESKLTSDPIKLTNSNPEFVTELAWQVDKRSLHQMRVERKAIKLQIFMQTQKRKKFSLRSSSQNTCTNGTQNVESTPTHKIELIGYTVIDIRTAQERDEPQFKWLPLLNPKFRKSSYNRPEVQLALTLSRVEDSASSDDAKPLPSTSSSRKTKLPSLECESGSNYSDNDSLIDSRLYKTCLDLTFNSDNLDKEQILDNDINIRSKDGFFYIYDTHDSFKPTINDCDERYKVVVTIPFNSELETLVTKPKDLYYFSVTLFGTLVKTDSFEDLTSVETKKVEFNIFSTSSSVLTRYFELNSRLEIKLHEKNGLSVGFATIQIDQLCISDSKCRSIEGIFAMQSSQDYELPAYLHPTIGVSVSLEKGEDSKPQRFISDEHIELAKEHFGEDIDEYFSKTLNDTHQLTFSKDNENSNCIGSNNLSLLTSSQLQDDQHFCFTIDLKNFSYTPDQRLIPTLRELVVRYSYPFFGYKDTITTDASIPISPTNSIIVSGFCEFNFATTTTSLVTALKEIPLNLDILTCDQVNIELNSNHTERVVATSTLNLAQIMGLNEDNVNELKEKQINTTVSTPIYCLNDENIGELQVYLCLKNLGPPNYNVKACVEENFKNSNEGRHENASPSAFVSLAMQKIDAFVCEAKDNLEHWKNDYCHKLSEEVKKREITRFRRLHQRLEAREARREYEFKIKMDELSKLEKQFNNSISYVENLEQMLSVNLEQLKTKDNSLESRLEGLDTKISKAINNIKSDYERRFDSLPIRGRSFEENRLEPKYQPKNSTKPSDLRRASLKSSSTVPGIPLPLRSSSLVRGPSDGSTRLIKRPTTMVTTVVNGTSCRSRPISTKLSLSKETQEKLLSLRKEKAELLKRGCRPNDDLIQEINSLIEKLAC